MTYCNHSVVKLICFDCPSLVCDHCTYWHNGHRTGGVSKFNSTLCTYMGI